MNLKKTVTKKLSPTLFEEKLCPPMSVAMKEDITNHEAANKVRVKTLHPTKPAASVKVYICEDCQKKYESSSGLRRHMVAKHPLQGTKQPIACREPQCTFTCRRLHALRNHLVEHGIKTYMETKPFDCIQGTFSSDYRNV